MRGMNDRIILTTDATAGGRCGDEDYRETKFRGEAKLEVAPKTIKNAIIGKIKGIWFPWKE